MTSRPAAWCVGVLPSPLLDRCCCCCCRGCGWTCTCVPAAAGPWLQRTFVTCCIAALTWSVACLPACPPQVSGAKFYYLRNEAALLELALVNYTMQKAGALAAGCPLLLAARCCCPAAAACTACAIAAAGRTCPALAPAAC